MWVWLFHLSLNVTIFIIFHTTYIPYSPALIVLNRSAPLFINIVTFIFLLVFLMV